jgi:hypothetical protein
MNSPPDGRRKVITCFSGRFEAVENFLNLGVPKLPGYAWLSVEIAPIFPWKIWWAEFLHDHPNNHHFLTNFTVVRLRQRKQSAPLPKTARL